MQCFSHDLAFPKGTPGFWREPGCILHRGPDYCCVYSPRKGADKSIMESILQHLPEVLRWFWLEVTKERKTLQLLKLFVAYQEYLFSFHDI